MATSMGIARGTTLHCNRGPCRKGTLPTGEAAMRKLFKQYQREAERRSHDFNLTLGEFKGITTRLCYYCGSSPSNIARQTDCNGSYSYNGIDRVDNDLGYTLDNSVPCCKYCNIMKLDRDFKSFVDHCRIISDKHKEIL